MTDRRRYAALVLAVLAPLPWYGWQGARLAGELGAVRDTAPAVETALRAGDLDAAVAAVRQAGTSASAAAERTRGVGWSVLEHAPVAGPVAESVRGLAEAAATLTSVALPVLPYARPLLTPSGPLLDRSRALPALTSAAGELENAQVRLSALQSRLDALPDHTGIAELDQATALTVSQVDKAHAVVGHAAIAARLLPSLLGQDGPRHYFLAFQTNAEARATGGLVGAFAILTADRGQISVRTLDSNHGVQRATGPVVDLGDTFRQLYGADPLLALNDSNLSPHFPNSARIWTSLWQRQTGQRLDGALAIDPTGLAYLLRSLGPLTLPGGLKLTSNNLVSLVERDAYAMYPDPIERKSFLVSVAKAVVARLATAKPSGGLVSAVEALADEHRLLMWSRHPEEQRILEGTPFGGILDDEPGPYAGLVINNAAGNKLDYYLDRRLSYRIGACERGRRLSTVQVRLVNGAPRGLPAYASSREDDPGTKHPPGSTKLWVSLYLPVGARLMAADADGRPLPLSGGVENGRPVHFSLVELLRGPPRTLTWRLVEPASAKAPRLPVQAMTRPQSTRVSTSGPCAAPAPRPPAGLKWQGALVLFAAGTALSTSVGLLLTRRRWSRRYLDRL